MSPSPPQPTTLVFPALIIPSNYNLLKVKSFTVLYQTIFMLSLVFLWPHFPQFRFFAPFLISHFPLHFIWMKFLIFHHSFLSECVLLIQFFWSYSPHLDLDILLLLLLWLRFLENCQHQRPLFSQLPPGFCFLSNSCQPLLCETECIIIIETNSVFKWKGVCGNEGDS